MTDTGQLSSLGSRLMQIVLNAGPEVFIDPMGTCLIRLPGQQECVRLSSRRVEDWISGLAWDQAGELVPASAIQQICRVLRSKALQTSPSDLQDMEAWQILLQEPCLQVLQEFLDRQQHGQHECQSGEFYKKLSVLADELQLTRRGRHWPKSAAALTRKFNAYASTLRAVGIEFDAQHRSMGSRVTLRTLPSEATDDTVVTPSPNSSVPRPVHSRHFDESDKKQSSSVGQNVLQRLLEIKENRNGNCNPPKRTGN